MKIILAVNYFHKTLHIVDVWQGNSEYMPQILNMPAFYSEYTGVLSIPGLLICQGSEYAFGSKYVRVLDIPTF